MILIQIDKGENMNRRDIINMYDKQIFKGSSSVWTTEKDLYSFIKRHETKTIWDY